MRYIGWALAALLLVVLSLVGLERIAAERVEVVEIHAKDPDGEVMTTRLWIVDYDGGMYLRVGGDGSGWYSRLQANETIEMTRAEQTRIYTATPQPEKSAAINALMQEKYTWGDTFIGNLVGSREGSIPILLQPAGP